MGDELELISDGDGLAIIGEPAAVERFLSSAGVPSRDLPLQKRLGAALSTGSGVAQAGSDIAANAGRWVKLTEESAKAMKVGQLMKGSSSGVSRAVVTNKGKVTKLLEFTKPGSIGSILTSPAMLAGAAGIMAQLAMQQTMEEITQYLAVIDEKVDDILRAQKDAAIAQMIGVGFVIDDAMTLREHTGRVSEVTWSKVQGAEQIIATTQGYALRQLDALAEKMEKRSKVGDLAKLAEDAETTVEEWLAVLARCFQLQDGLAILELDRVLDSGADDLDRHRTGLQSARRKRRDQIARSTARLMERMDAASGIANTQVLLHPLKAGAVVRSGNEVAADVIVFNERLGIEAGRRSLEAKRWKQALGEAKDQAVETGVDGVELARRLGAWTVEGAKSVAGKVSHDIAERLPHRRPDELDDDRDL
ncbi:hypothetical protein N1027_17980 [Herbiconiux sp. CPCC 205763]|uniref:Uncharacterized protein n=1 Tax=Herbiconiux aconitum TaxID=2970913 RepID=A0ABT2GUY7_9MICO|nr:hypothetical protein [Herbiconiux aconitum]MCS5720024.1 hypothetical protein [Herbiconiux aconitum]